MQQCFYFTAELSGQVYFTLHGPDHFLKWSGIFSFVFFAGEFHNVFAAVLTHPLAGFIRLSNVTKYPAN
jgi:hypothetical protein